MSFGTGTDLNLVVLVPAFRVLGLQASAITAMKCCFYDQANTTKHILVNETHFH